MSAACTINSSVCDVQPTVANFSLMAVEVYPLLALSLLAVRLTLTRLIRTELSVETKYPLKFK
jgi:hypothetical protein